MTSSMLNRREMLRLALASVMLGMIPTARGAPATARLVLVHGRAQQGQDPALLKSQWIDALKKGAQAVGCALPNGIDIAFPYYGDTLEKLTREFDIPLTSDIHTRGTQVDDEFLAFQAELAEALRQGAGVTDAQVDVEYGPNPKPKGPLNREWVQAILRALDKHAGGVSQVALESFTRDVFLYTTRAGVREEIDQIVAAALTEEPTVVVGHSLGSVVAYNVLRSDKRNLRVPLYATVGCPLAIRPIRDQFRPLKFPAPVGAWFNAFDDRDVVALYALDPANFAVTPAVDNYSKVKNHTANRHGIAGYLDDPVVAKRILNALGT
jgi:hypothetical protein